MPLRCVSVLWGWAKPKSCNDMQKMLDVGGVSMESVYGMHGLVFYISVWDPTGPQRNIAEAKCENVWMEVCTKVAAAALVSVPWRVSAWGCDR